MKILFDHQMFSLQKYGGITKYFCELLKNSPGKFKFNLSLLFSSNHYLKEDQYFFKKKIVPLPNIDFKGKGFLERKIYSLNKRYSRHSISLNNFDLFHPTFYDNYFFDNLKKRYVITVHDLIAFKFDCSYKADMYQPLMKKIIKNAERIISISHNTRKDIIETFNVNPEKIDVIYHGYNKPKIKPEKNIYGRYILFVGLRHGYKNFTIAVNAISTLLKSETDIMLICVGAHFDKSEITQFNRLKISDQVIALRVDENSLNNLYAHALLLVYPSLYEGFGMPILEAFANDCPVCLSDASCFPEIAGKAGVYFDPYDQESILAAIIKVIYNNSYRVQIINLGKERLAEFSWSKTASQTVLSYTKALS